MERKISIKKQDVMQGVMKATSYLAARKGESNENADSQYLKIVATTSDIEMLTPFYTDACETMRLTVAEYATVAQDTTDDGITFTLTMPSNWKEGTLDLDERALSYCINYVTAKWLELSSKDDVEYYSQCSQADLALLIDALSYRNRPTRESGVSLCNVECWCQKIKRMNIVIQKSEAYHNIKQMAYTYAHALSGEGITSEIKHNIYDLCEEGNIDITARLLDQTVTDCNALLARFMVDYDVDFLDNSWDSCQGNPTSLDDYTLSAILPESFAMRYAKPIFNNIVAYITNKVLASWLTIVYPAGVEQFTAAYTEAQQKLTEYSQHLKPGTVRIVPKWI